MAERAEALPTRLELGDAEVDLVERVVRRSGEVTAALTALEVGVLAQLGAAPGVAVPREALLAAVWGAAATVRTRAVENTVSRLRRKIEPDPREPRWLVSVPGGYALAAAPLARAPLADDPTPFVGRVAELDALARALGRPGDPSHGQPVAIVGPAGVGVSRLASRAAAAWHDQGGDVVLAAFGGDDPDPGFALARVLGIRADRVGCALSARPRTLAVVDVDVDAADVSAGPRLAAAAAWVDANAGHIAARILIAAPAWPGDARVVPLGPLSPAEGAALVAHLRGAAVDHVDGERVTEAAGGLPLGIGLVAGWLPDVPAPPDVGTVGRALDASWARLGASERRLLEIAAALDGAVRASDLVAGAGTPDDLPVAARLVRLGWLRRDAVRLAMPSSIRRFVRRRGAVSADAAARHARWLLGWAPTAARERWRAWDPARDARLRGAAPQLAQALALPDPADAVLAAEALVVGLPGDAAVAEAVLRRFTPPIPAEPRASFVVGLASRAVGATDQAVDALRAARDALTTADDPEVAGAVLAALGDALADRVRDRADPTDARDASAMLRTAIGLFDTAEAAVRSGLAGLALAELHIERGSLADAEGEAHAALAALADRASPSELARAHAVVARVHHRLGAADAADGHLRRAEALALSDADRAALALGWADVCLDRADLAGAHARAEAARAGFRALGDVDGSARATNVLAAVDVDRARFEAALARTHPGDAAPSVARDARWIAGIALAWLGRADDAVRTLDAAASAGGPGPSDLAARLDADRAVVRALAGDTHGAAALLDALPGPLADLGRAVLAGDDPARAPRSTGHRERRSARLAQHVARAVGDRVRRR